MWLCTGKHRTKILCLSYKNPTTPTNFHFTEYLVNHIPFPTWCVCVCIIKVLSFGRWVEESIPHFLTYASERPEGREHRQHINNHQFCIPSLWFSLMASSTSLMANFFFLNPNFHLIFRRFKSKLVRRLASFSFIIRNCLTLGITIYTPSVALNIIAGIPYWASLTTMTLLTIMFTITVSQLNQWTNAQTKVWPTEQYSSVCTRHSMHSTCTLVTMTISLSCTWYVSLVYISPFVGRIKGSNYGRCNTRTNFASGLYFCDNSRSIWNWWRWESLHDQQRQWWVKSYRKNNTNKNHWNVVKKVNREQTGKNHIDGDVRRAYIYIHYRIYAH